MARDLQHPLRPSDSFGLTPWPEAGRDPNAETTATDSIGDEVAEVPTELPSARARSTRSQLNRHR
jgi:hypothetical protein